MFSRARFRLTAWFVVVMAAFVTVLGVTVYYVVQDQLRKQVDDGVKTVARHTTHDVRRDYLAAIMAGQSLSDIHYLDDRDIAALADGGLYKLTVVPPPGSPSAPAVPVPVVKPDPAGEFAAAAGRTPALSDLCLDGAGGWGWAFGRRKLEVLRAMTATPVVYSSLNAIKAAALAGGPKLTVAVGPDEDRNGEPDPDADLSAEVLAECAATSSTWSSPRRSARSSGSTSTRWPSATSSPRS